MTDMKPIKTTDDLAAAYKAEQARAMVKIDWTRPTAGILDQTEKRNNTRLFQADTMAEAMALATAEADKIVAATKRNVGVFLIGDVRIPNPAAAQSMALAWKGGAA